MEDWQRENNEPLDGIPRLNTYEIKAYQTALRYARDTGCQLEKDIINTLTICQNNYEATNKVMDISGLPDFGKFEHWKAAKIRLYEIEAMKKARVAHISDVKQISKQVMMDFISSPTTNLHLIKSQCGSLERNMKKSAEELINHTVMLDIIQGKIQEEIKRYHNDWEQARSKKDAPPSGSQ